MKIKNILPFVITPMGDIGIADEYGPFASAAWCISEELFNSTSGSKFGWFAPDGKLYTESRDIFSRPTEEQVLLKISVHLVEKARELNLIEV